MTILELQKELQEKYEKYGDIEVVMEDTDWIGIERYHDEIFIVKKCKVQRQHSCCAGKQLRYDKRIIATIWHCSYSLLFGICLC